jgi:hypothetical protein
MAQDEGGSGSCAGGSRSYWWWSWSSRYAGSPSLARRDRRSRLPGARSLRFRHVRSLSQGRSRRIPQRPRPCPPDSVKRAAGYVTMQFPARSTSALIRTRFDVIYYMLLESKPGPQEVTLNYRIYATPSAARTAFQDRRYPCGQAGGLGRNARPTAGLKPYPGLLVDELGWFPLPRTSFYKRCYKPTVGPICWTTRAWALVGDVLVSANAGLGLRTGNAPEAIKLARAGIRHLVKIERGVK